MKENTCNGCMYYRQHYVFDQRKIFRVHCGHCTYQKAKSKKPTEKVCESYIPSDPDEKAFVTKEYLSKSLLAYMLKLDLLPEIQDGEQSQEMEKFR